MDREEIDELVRSLREDELRNISIVNFAVANPLLEVRRAGSSVRLVGRSDHVWNYFSSERADELRSLAEQLGADDDRFAAVEDWMVPILCRGRAMAWCLRVVRFALPWGAELPVESGEVGALYAGDAEEVVAHSKYQAYISVDYARSCILGGLSVAIRDGGRPVAWAMTQDDGAMGFLQVLEPYQRRGFGRRITIALASALRRENRLPFAYVEEDNLKAMSLLSTLGFVRDRAVQWFHLK